MKIRYLCLMLSAGGHSAIQNKEGDYVIAHALP
jgi:glucose dehydrogenase